MNNDNVVGKARDEISVFFRNKNHLSEQSRTSPGFVSPFDLDGRHDEICTLNAMHELSNQVALEALGSEADTPDRPEDRPSLLISLYDDGLTFSPTDILFFPLLNPN